MTADQLLASATDRYLTSGDFNGYPLRDAPVGRPELEDLLTGLVESDLLSLSLGSPHPNPHIKAFPAADAAEQLAALASTPDLTHVTAYPETAHLRDVVDVANYDGRPYTLRLAQGASQLLPAAFFDLQVLEAYRNDPRYLFTCGEAAGTISVSDEFYGAADMRPADQVLLETFGFGFDEQRRRAVAVFPIYLSRMSAEHQQLWAARELGNEHVLHPAYQAGAIFGEFYERESIFRAFVEELDQLQRMCALADRPPIVRSSFADCPPANFTFMLRPTLKELQDFHSTLDKLMSDNLNKKFFEAEGLATETESSRPDGKVVVSPKGTITLLQEWLESCQVADRSKLDELVKTFRDVRKLRQRPAHAADDNRFDVAYYDEQRELIGRAYTAVRLLRLLMINYPGVGDYDGVPGWLYEGHIYDY